MIQLSFDQTLAVLGGMRYVFTDGDQGHCCRNCDLEGMSMCRSVAFCEPHRRKDTRNGYWKAAKT